jgi:hypothetical protein
MDATLNCSAPSISFPTAKAMTTELAEVASLTKLATLMMIRSYPIMGQVGAGTSSHARESLA